MFKKEILFLPFVTLLILSGCATTPTPAFNLNPKWTIYDIEKLRQIKTIVVLGSEDYVCRSGDINYQTLMIQALVSEIESSKKFSVRTYRDILVAMENPQIKLPFITLQIDLSLAVSLGEKLKVDAVCIVWVMRCGETTGDHVKVIIFSTKDGKALGKFITMRSPTVGRTSVAGRSATYYSYSPSGNAQLMAYEAVEALLTELK